MAVPIFLALSAGPLAGLVDTAFVKELGAAPTAALGVAVGLLDSVLWIFNFLGIGAQTEVARARGAADDERGRSMGSLAIALGCAFGLVLVAVGWPYAEAAVALMTPDGDVRAAADEYLRIRLLGAPAALVLVAVFGALRGVEDMRTPMWIAIASHALNIALDPLLIFGLGPVPALGIAGAAWATVASQWLPVLWALVAFHRRLGLTSRLRAVDVGALVVVGRDMTVRTGLLMAFLLLATRAANELGEIEGAAHQAIRQAWMFCAFSLDAFAVTAQSLVGFFVGAGAIGLARRAAGVGLVWCVGSATAWAAAMLVFEPWIASILVPAGATAVFAVPWLVAAVSQPLNGIAFLTDGVHWGTGDYAYLRNVMIVATGCGAAGLAGLEATGRASLTTVWLVTSGWIALRAVAGTLRIWPGIGRARLRG